MHVLGHVGVAAAVYAPIGAWLVTNVSRSVALAGLLVALCVSTLPDADETLPVRHRGPTHTVWFVVCCAGIAGAVGAIAVTPTTVEWTTGATVLGGVTALSLTSHLLADVVTPMGIRPFEPISSASYSLDLVLSKDRRANRTLFTIGLLATILAFVFAGF